MAQMKWHGRHDEISSDDAAMSGPIIEEMKWPATKAWPAASRQNAKMRGIIARRINRRRHGVTPRNVARRFHRMAGRYREASA